MNLFIMLFSILRKVMESKDFKRELKPACELETEAKR